MINIKEEELIHLKNMILYEVKQKMRDFGRGLTDEEIQEIIDKRLTELISKKINEDARRIHSEAILYRTMKYCMGYLKGFKIEADLRVDEYPHVLIIKVYYKETDRKEV